MEEGNSHSSLGPVTPTSNEMMKEKRILKVETEYSEICFEKIKSVLEKLEETGDVVVDTLYNARNGTVMVSGYFDPEKLKMELKNEMGDAIESITDPIQSIHRGRDGTAMAMNYFETEKLEWYRLKN